MEFVAQLLEQHVRVDQHRAQRIVDLVRHAGRQEADAGQLFAAHDLLGALLDLAVGARRLIVGETFTPSGNWSTYPPHKHEVDNLPHEARHEEMYFFKVSPSDGFGLCHYYNSQGEEENFTIRDNSVHMMASGYHTVVSAPGYTTYYLWFLAGEQRAQAVVDDPALGWVGRTVPMLKDLGHG